MAKRNIDGLYQLLPLLLQLQQQRPAARKWCKQ